MKRKVIFISIIGMLIYMNFFSVNMNIKSFKSEELSSQLVENDQYKKVDSEKMSVSGYLSYGPYYQVNQGHATVWIYYKTDTIGNTFDVYADNSGQVLYSGELDPLKECVKVNIKLDESDVIEVRTMYCGNGALEVSKVDVAGRRNDLIAVIILYDVLLLIYMCYFALKQFKIFRKNS